MYQTHSKIEAFLKEVGINRYTINQNMSVDVHEGVCIWSDIKKLPIQFNEVFGYFSCSNGSLTTLEGVPKVVQGDFNCSSNNLGSLKYAPEFVKGDFNCSRNRIKNFDFATTEITGSLICRNNPIEHFNHFQMNVKDTIIHSADHENEKIPFLKESYQWNNFESLWLLMLNPQDITVLSEKYHLEKSLIEEKTNTNTHRIKI